MAGPLTGWSEKVFPAIHLDPSKSATVDLTPGDRMIIVVGRETQSPTVAARAASGAAAD